MSGAAFVTGPSRGVGRAVALACARRGLDVALFGGPSPALDAVAVEVRALGVRALVTTGDVAVEADVTRARDEVLAGLGAPDLVVNNAGIVHRGPTVDETDPADWDRVVAVNLRGPFLVSRAFVPAMRARGSGRLVHVASISSTMGCPGNASYAASKWGLVGLAKSLAEELRGSGVASVAVLPGSIDTDMLKGSGFAPEMTPDEVAALVCFVGLDAPAAIQGSAVEMFGR